MNGGATKEITAGCTIAGAELKVSFDVADLVEEMQKTLEKRLLKKGVAVRWVDESTPRNLAVRIVEVDQGNQFLRYLLPFIAPALIEVEGEIAVGTAPQPFSFVQKAQIGLFGGSAKGMLKVCAQRSAMRVAKDLLKALGL